MFEQVPFIRSNDLYFLYGTSFLWWKYHHKQLLYYEYWNLSCLISSTTCEILDLFDLHIFQMVSCWLHSHLFYAPKSIRSYQLLFPENYSMWIFVANALWNYSSFLFVYFFCFDRRFERKKFHFHLGLCIVIADRFKI